MACLIMPQSISIIFCLIHCDLFNSYLVSDGLFHFSLFDFFKSLFCLIYLHMAKLFPIQSLRFNYVYLIMSYLVLACWILPYSVSIMLYLIMTYLRMTYLIIMHFMFVF